MPSYVQKFMNEEDYVKVIKFKYAIKIKLKYKCTHHIEKYFYLNQHKLIQ